MALPWSYNTPTSASSARLSGFWLRNNVDIPGLLPCDPATHRAHGLSAQTEAWLVYGPAGRHCCIARLSCDDIQLVRNLDFYTNNEHPMGPEHQGFADRLLAEHAAHYQSRPNNLALFAAVELVFGQPCIVHIVETHAACHDSLWSTSLGFHWTSDGQRGLPDGRTWVQSTMQVIRFGCRHVVPVDSAGATALRTIELCFSDFTVPEGYHAALVEHHNFAALSPQALPSGGQYTTAQRLARAPADEAHYLPLGHNPHARVDLRTYMYVSRLENDWPTLSIRSHDFGPVDLTHA